MEKSNGSYPDKINLLTLNCWGLKFLSKYRHERLKAIGEAIACADPFPDIVCLQECWTGQDYSSVREQLRPLLPFGKFYHSGIFGGGLAIFSRWPIVGSNMVRYPLNGRPTAFFRGDWFVGKGVACAKIRIGPERDDILEVFNTHLHAPYENGMPTDSYICHRVAQAWEIARLMRDATERGHLVLGLGDFNMLPLSLEHRIIETHGNVLDIWRILHPNSSLGAANDPEEKKRGLPVPNVDFNLIENGAASDNIINTWRMSEADRKRLSKGLSVDIGGSTPDPMAKRLDYIFIGGSTVHRAEGKLAWIVEHAHVGMTAKHKTLHCSLSDHFSVEATITCRRFEGDQPHGSREQQNQIPPADFSSGTKYLPIFVYDSVIDLIHTYRRREEGQRKLRLGHFGIGFFVSIGCLVAIWWSPRNYASFLLILVSTLSLSTGVLDGLIGGLFIGTELRALKEFEWETRNARELAAMDEGQINGKSEV